MTSCPTENNKDFSIIIPLYNASKHVSSLVKNLSALDFDFDRFEVIFVDDNSTDDTREKLQNYAALSDLETRVIGAIRNGGPGSARNIGVEEASGAFIVFLDADDFLSRDTLRRLSLEIAKHQNKTVDVLYFDL